jgi:hypothetical protein
MLVENLREVEGREQWLSNALGDLLDLCMNHRELSADGIKYAPRLRDMAGAGAEEHLFKWSLDCDIADFTAVAMPGTLAFDSGSRPREARQTRGSR